MDVLTLNAQNVYPFQGKRLLNLKGGIPALPDRFYPKDPVGRFVQDGDFRQGVVSSYEKPDQHLSGLYIYGGFLVPHFGHQLHDHALSLVQGARLLHQHPQATLLLCMKPNNRMQIDISNLLQFQFSLLAHFGIPKDRVQFVDQPVCVEQILVPSLYRDDGNSLKTSSDVQQFLTESLSRLGKPLKNLHKNIFLTRSSFKGGRCGRLAGEAHLATFLSEKGYRAVEPENLFFKRQMQLLLNADNIILTEGSAAHFIELLPSLSAKITILCRRPPENRIPAAYFKAMNIKVQMIECAQQIKPFTNRETGNPVGYYALGLLDKDLLTTQMALHHDIVFDKAFWQRQHAAEIADLTFFRTDDGFPDFCEPVSSAKHDEFLKTLTLIR